MSHSCQDSWTTSCLQCWFTYDSELSTLIAQTTSYKPDENTSSGCSTVAQLMTICWASIQRLRRDFFRETSETLMSRNVTAAQAEQDKRSERWKPSDIKLTCNKTGGTTLAAVSCSELGREYVRPSTVVMGKMWHFASFTRLSYHWQMIKCSIGSFFCSRYISVDINCIPPSLATDLDEYCIKIQLRNKSLYWRVRCHSLNVRGELNA